ncbi:MAG: NAD-dependent deacylase [Thermoanaerobaculia bacterium]|nr:NAD-dependent deacylase [Thermoanaerobaculia bacterium]MCZ7651035.1 NAD-dependent deacylase [Thermoanaerobaculia bacterium]
MGAAAVGGGGGGERRAAEAPPAPLAGWLAGRPGGPLRVVVLSGAGLSAGSGLATFRGADGHWQRYRPEELATPQAFARRPEVVWEWYAARFRAAAAAEPNAGHREIARWEGRFTSLTVVTQNVDGLHQRAGTPDPLELHGSLVRARCAACGERLPMADAVARPGAPPRCACGGRLRPDVVWFGEALPIDALSRADHAARKADLFVVAGTSAQVFPAAGLIEVAARAGALVVEVNPEATPFSSLAGLRLAGPAEVELPRLGRWIAP